MGQCPPSAEPRPGACLVTPSPLGFTILPVRTWTCTRLPFRTVSHDRKNHLVGTPVPTQRQTKLRVRRPRADHPSQARSRIEARHFRKTLAVDYGLKRVGLAVSVGIAPRPLPCFTHDSSAKRAADKVAGIATQNCVVDIVVGLPLTATGAEGEQALATREFTDALAKSASWTTIYFLDERYTTVEARALLEEANVPKHKIPDLLDSAAAVQIAQRYFNDLSETAAILVHSPPATTETDESGNMRGTVDTFHGDAAEEASNSAWKRSAWIRAAGEDPRAGRSKHRNSRRRRKKK